MHQEKVRLNRKSYLIDVTTGIVRKGKLLPEGLFFSHSGDIFMRKGNLYAMGVGSKRGQDISYLNLQRPVTVVYKI